MGSSRLSCLLWEMKSPRMTAPTFSMNWQVLRMKMVCSPTLPSWTNCAARHKSSKPKPNQKNNQDPKINYHQTTKFLLTERWPLKMANRNEKKYGKLIDCILFLIYFFSEVIS